MVLIALGDLQRWLSLYWLFHILMQKRVFSMVRKNKTAFRPSLDPKGTLSSLLTIKLASTGPAHKFEPPKEVLKAAKSTTTVYNKTHSKK